MVCDLALITFFPFCTWNVAYFQENNAVATHKNQRRDCRDYTKKYLHHSHCILAHTVYPIYEYLMDGVIPSIKIFCNVIINIHFFLVDKAFLQCIYLFFSVNPIPVEMETWVFHFSLMAMCCGVQCDCAEKTTW